MANKNVPFQKHEVADYERRRYKGIDQKIVDSRERNILKKILKRMTSYSRLALDVPCGYGRFSQLLLERNFSIVSSDLSFHMVNRAVHRDLGKDNQKHLGCIVDAKKLMPFMACSFDIVFCMRFFHHVHEKKERETILKEFSRISRKWLILSYYEINQLHLLQRKLRKKMNKSRTRIKMISNKDFYEEAEKTGWRAIKIFSLFPGIHSQHIALLRKIKIEP